MEKVASQRLRGKGGRGLTDGVVDGDVGAELPAPVPTLGWLLLPHAPPTRHTISRFSGKMQKKMLFYFCTICHTIWYKSGWHWHSSNTSPSLLHPPGSTLCADCEGAWTLGPGNVRTFFEGQSLAPRSSVDPLQVRRPSPRSLSGGGGGACGSSISVSINYRHACPILCNRLIVKELRDDYDF